MAIQLPANMHPNTVEAINALLTAYNTENLRHSLMEYPRRIREARQAVNQARKALKDAELERATIEAELVLAISTETDEKGKTKYSNAEARAAELLRRKASDPRYLEADQKVSMAEAEFNEASDTLQQLIDEYQSLRFAARLVVAELSMLSELAALEEIPEIQNKEAF